ncbi:cupin domain-containing protein [uncultured Microbacterium sp.]|uniref:cupin domain-containing protein n=1 Tax=uncultured Microbacterium sp. TaxID=191216 RepID=UPI0035C9E220
MKTVITAETADGRSIVAREERPIELVASGFPQFGNVPLDASDGPIPLPNDGTRHRNPSFFPPAGGYRFFLLRIDPQNNEPTEPPSVDQWAEAEAMFPGLFSGYGDDGLERTDTVDFGYVVEGSATLVLGDGSETRLEAGDAFVQNGTRHRWYNPGDAPATLVIVITGQPRG